MDDQIPEPPKWSDVAPKDLHKEWKRTERNSKGRGIWDLDEHEANPIHLANFERAANQDVLGKIAHGAIKIVGAHQPVGHKSVVINPNIPSGWQAFHDDGESHMRPKDALNISHFFHGIPDGVLNGDHQNQGALRTMMHEFFHAASPRGYDYHTEGGKALEEATTEILAQHYAHQVASHSMDYTSNSPFDWEDNLFRVGFGEDNPGHLVMQKRTAYSDWVNRFSRMALWANNLHVFNQNEHPRDLVDAREDEHVRRAQNAIVNTALAVKKVGGKDWWNRPQALMDIIVQRKLGMQPPDTDKDPSQTFHPYFAARNYLMDYLFHKGHENFMSPEFSDEGYKPLDLALDRARSKADSHSRWE